MTEVNKYSLKKFWYQPCFLRTMHNYKPLSHRPVQNSKFMKSFLSPSHFYYHHRKVLFCLLVPDQQMQARTALPWTPVCKGQSHSWLVFFGHERQTGRWTYNQEGERAKTFCCLPPGWACTPLGPQPSMNPGTQLLYVCITGDALLLIFSLRKSELIKFVLISSLDFFTAIHS